MPAQYHKCFHSMHFLSLLTCWPGSVRPATECWSSTVRTQTSEAAARSRSAVLITRVAGLAGCREPGPERWDTDWEDWRWFIRERTTQEQCSSESGWWGDTYTRESPHNMLHPSSSLLRVCLCAVCHMDDMDDKIKDLDRTFSWILKKPLKVSCTKYCTTNVRHPFVEYSFVSWCLV